VSRAVCLNCWTWHIKGETVCRRCQTPLTVTDAAPTPGGGPSTDPAPPTPPSATLPTATSRFNRMLLLPIGILAIVAVIAIGVLISLSLGGPAVAADGHFSVKAPKGWGPTITSVVAGHRVVLALAKLSDGEWSNFSVMDFGQPIPLADIQDHWGEVIAEMKAQTGKLTTTTIGGVPALTVDIELPEASGQLLFVDYGDITYMVALRAVPSQYEQMRSGDFQAILSSWQWR
jgi:hypothetical protein